MNTGKYVFSQVIDFLSFDDFNRFVKKYKGNYKIKTFSCWNQLLRMVFGQLANRQSLSDLVQLPPNPAGQVVPPRAGGISHKSQLAHANEHRDWRIYSEFAYFLIAKARKICAGTADFEMKVAGNVYAVDSPTVDLCLDVFWWAKFRKHKAAVKLHTHFDIKTDIPHFIQITEGAVHDVNIMDVLVYEPGGFYIFDRGYVDFERLYSIHKSQAWFIRRPKENMNYRRLYSSPADKEKGIKVDQTIRLNNHYANKNYPDKLRLVKYRDAETGLDLEFLTNNFDITALEVALLYKHRWRAELFFKWIKQHLKIQAFGVRRKTQCTSKFILP